MDFLLAVYTMFWLD